MGQFGAENPAVGAFATAGVDPSRWTPDLLREKGVHGATNETAVSAGVPAAVGEVYAAALRPELHRFAADGSPEWVATWPREGVEESRFGIAQGTLVPEFRLIQQAVVEGPDGTLYARGDEGPADRLLVFDSDGRLMRAGIVDPWGAIYVGHNGHVYTSPSPEALACGEAVASAGLFADFALPELGGETQIRLGDHLGKTVVVNFWASWCVPCRQEMPLLDELARELDPYRAVVLGLNEDVTPQRALDFLDELGGVSYPVAEGRGRLRNVYSYRGLPYTVVVAPDGRAVKAFYGFGSTIEPIRDAVRTAVAAAR